MAIIETNQHAAQVRAVGEARSATVNFSGALMEMLATTYSYILMAAVRESIQNACDAVRRSGKRVSEGVFVTLPTAENPMFVVQDHGPGMTAEFMDTTYLSFGSSTKSGDNGAAGGLGVGRWAAYGYIRECLIATCHESDMIERTYFQYQDSKGMPQVQLASEAPGDVVGTRVSFPIKPADIKELYNAVSWLQEIMKLTMGDTFTVDAPRLLPENGVLPEVADSILELGKYDATLEGVRVYPMQGDALQYGLGGNLSRGSLVVLTNQEQGVGGLPFHVRSARADASVFSTGMIVEIPMSFRVPFMPSREEIKYTDEMVHLMNKIDEAAAQAALDRVTELYECPDLNSKATLSRFVGTNENWHWFARAMRGSSYLAAKFRAVMKGHGWTGYLPIRRPAALPLTDDLTLRVVVDTLTLRQTIWRDNELHLPMGDKAPVRVQFSAKTPIILVYNDMPSGGVTRFRAYLKEHEALVTGSGRNYGEGRQTFLYIDLKDHTRAREVAEMLNEQFGGQLEMRPTSSFPEVARRVSGTRIVRGAGTRLAFYSLSEGKQDAEYLEFTTPVAAGVNRYWVQKTGSAVRGFIATLPELTGSYYSGDLRSIMRALNSDKLYLLTAKHEEQLLNAIEAAQSEGLFDMDESEFDSDAEGRELLETVRALKSWVPLEQGLKSLFELESVQNALNGINPYRIQESHQLRAMCLTLAEEPRFVLKDSKFDAAVSPFIDTLSGTIKMKTSRDVNDSHRKLCEALVFMGQNMEVKDDDPIERKEFVESLKLLQEMGTLDYGSKFADLQQQFPLLKVVLWSSSNSKEGINHICSALVNLYG